jgi:hypothetical protein
VRSALAHIEDGMNTSTSVKIIYWAERKDNKSLYDFVGIEEFRQELDQSYVSIIQGRPGPLGGLHELAVEFIAQLTLIEVAKFLLEGIAFDLIKSGTKAFVLRPFLAAYEKLKGRNPTYRLDIEELRIMFQDTTVVIHKLTNDSIFPHLDKILRTIAFHSAKLTLGTGERPFEIHVPIFEDPTQDRLCRFRVMLDVDETIRNISTSDYFQLWGLRYDYAGDRVYNLEKGLIIENEFYTLDRYWPEMEERWQREREQVAPDKALKPTPPRGGAS